MATVQTILNLKGSEILTGDPTMTIGQVCAKLAEFRIGALVMADEGRNVLGIVSERDIVRVLATNGPAVLDEAASKHMTRKVVTCSRKDTIDELMEMMTRGRFRHLPVVEAGKLVGLISIGDIVKHRMAEIESEANAIREYIATA